VAEPAQNLHLEEQFKNNNNQIILKRSDSLQSVRESKIQDFHGTHNQSSRKP
jgi:hypothetical protein